MKDFHRHYLTTYKYSNKIRLGNRGDGGYVIGDGIGDYDCYISAGVNDEESFTRDFIRHFSMPLEKNYAFDGTIQNYPYEYTQDIHFVRKNIGLTEDDKYTNLKYLFRRYENIFLKMDIEGCEIQWFNMLSGEEMSKIKQMVVEFHSINDSDFGATYNDKIKCLAKLNETHFIIHAHGNSNGTGWGMKREEAGIPGVIELTYIRSDMLHSPQLNDQPLPDPDLDFINCPNYPELSLDFPPFCFRDRTVS